MACFIFSKFLIYLICINAKLNYQVKCNQSNTKYILVPMLMVETCKYHKDINGWGTINSTTVTLNHDTHSKCFLKSFAWVGWAVALVGLAGIDNLVSLHHLIGVGWALRGDGRDIAWAKKEGIC